MNINYKGNYKFKDPKYYEGGAHFKYLDLYNKLIELKTNVFNSFEENKSNIEERILNVNTIEVSNIKYKTKINPKFSFNKSSNNNQLKITEYSHLNHKIENKIILPIITKKNQSNKENDLINLQTYQTLYMGKKNKIFISLKKRDDYNDIFPNIKKNNSLNLNSKYKNNYLSIRFLTKNGDFFSEYVNSKREKINQKFKFNFLKNKIHQN